MLGNDWRITRVLLRKRPGRETPRESHARKDSNLCWSLYLGLVLSFVVTIFASPDLPSAAFDPVFGVHAAVAAVSVFVCFSLLRNPIAARFGLILVLLVAILAMLQSVSDGLLLIAPFFSYAVAIITLAFTQIARLDPVEDAT